MKPKLLLGLCLFICTLTRAQRDSIILPEPETLSIEFLVTEALMNNPALHAMEFRSSAMQAKISQAGALDPPELRYMREGMPDFNYAEAMFSRIDVEQTIPFPSKLANRRELAEIQAEHADHDRQEKMNDVIANLKSAFFELWFIQQNLILEQENSRLMQQFNAITETRYATGLSDVQDLIKSRVELALISSELTTLRQEELSTKAVIMSFLNRPPQDTVGYAVIPDDVIFDANLDSLISLAVHTRPMIVHDSLMITEGEAMQSLVHQDYLPDFRVALERITAPTGNLRGWSVSLGVTLPFAPWSIGKTSSEVEEAAARIDEARFSYQSTRSTIIGNIRDLFYKIEAAKHRLMTYRLNILPLSDQALKASLTSYKTGKTGFLDLIETFRSKVNFIKEYFMTRKDFEQTVARLEQEVGTQNISSFK